MPVFSDLIVTPLYDPATGEGVLSRLIEDTDEKAGLICDNKEEEDSVRHVLRMA